MNTPETTPPSIPTTSATAPLEVLRAGLTDYVINAEALAYIHDRGVVHRQYLVDQLASEQILIKSTAVAATPGPRP